MLTWNHQACGILGAARRGVGVYDALYLWRVGTLPMLFRIIGRGISFGVGSDFESEAGTPSGHTEEKSQGGSFSIAAGVPCIRRSLDGMDSLVYFLSMEKRGSRASRVGRMHGLSRVRALMFVLRWC